MPALKLLRPRPDALWGHGAESSTNSSVTIAALGRQGRPTERACSASRPSCSLYEYSRPGRPRSRKERASHVPVERDPALLPAPFCSPRPWLDGFACFLPSPARPLPPSPCRFLGRHTHLSHVEFPLNCNPHGGNRSTESFGSRCYYLSSQKLLFRPCTSNPIPP